MRSELSGSADRALRAARTSPTCKRGTLNHPRVFPRLRCGLVWPALALYCLAISGCGSDGNLATVRGTVTLNGRPLQNALVEFQPTGPHGSPSSGITDAEGRYELMYTFDKPGAIPGEHRVSIRTGGTRLDSTGQEVECKECLPAKYNTQTELQRTVQPGRNTLDFDLCQRTDKETSGALVERPQKPA
jgi:hypothetical protein